MFLVFSCLYSQEESIQPDRPDQSESTSTVPFHYLQIETGLLSEKVNKNENSSLLPTILWKYAISPKTELRLITEAELLKENKNSEYNFKPITIGMKTALIKEKGWLPDIAFLGHLEVLSKNSEGTERVVPSFRFAFQNTLSETISLSYNLGMQWNPDLQEFYHYTFTIGKSFSEKLGGFAEFYGFLSPHSLPITVLMRVLLICCTMIWWWIFPEVSGFRKFLPIILFP